MAGTDDKHSVHGEPQFNKDSFAPDPSEEAAARRLSSEKAAADADEERARHSVFDEPAVLPNRPAVEIDRDWICRNCSYNLRGLLTGHPCPECGTVERYEPPRESELSYADWVRRQEDKAPARKCWMVASVVPLLSLPLAFGSGLVTVEYSTLIYFVVLGPLLAEVLKVAIASTLIERRTYLVRTTSQIHLMTLGTAVVFAAAQNVIYLTFYFSNAPLELATYRWLIGPILHGACTLIATRGLVSVWERAGIDHRQVRVTGAFPHLLVAVVLHAAFNACIFLRGHLGYGF